MDDNIYIYIYIYIYCHPKTDCFVVSQHFSVARHVGHLKLGSEPTQLYVSLCIIPLSQQANHVSLGIIRHCVAAFVCLHFCLTGYQNAQFIRRALHYTSGSHNFLRQNAQTHVGSVYIVTNRQTVSLYHTHTHTHIQLYIYIHITLMEEKV